MPETGSDQIKYTTETPGSGSESDFAKMLAEAQERMQAETDVKFDALSQKIEDDGAADRETIQNAHDAENAMVVAAREREEQMHADHQEARAAEARAGIEEAHADSEEVAPEATPEAPVAEVAEPEPVVEEPEPSAMDNFQGLLDDQSEAEVAPEPEAVVEAQPEAIVEAPAETAPEAAAEPTVEAPVETPAEPEQAAEAMPETGDAIGDLSVENINGKSDEAAAEEQPETAEEVESSVMTQGRSVDSVMEEYGVSRAVAEAVTAEDGRLDELDKSAAEILFRVQEMDNRKDELEELQSGRLSRSEQKAVKAELKQLDAEYNSRGAEMAALRSEREEIILRVEQHTADIQAVEEAGTTAAPEADTEKTMVIPRVEEPAAEPNPLDLSDTAPVHDAAGQRAFEQNLENMSVPATTPEAPAAEPTPEAPVVEPSAAPEASAPEAAPAATELTLDPALDLGESAPRTVESKEDFKARLKSIVDGEITPDGAEAAATPEAAPSDTPAKYGATLNAEGRWEVPAELQESGSFRSKMASVMAESFNRIADIDAKLKADIEAVKSGKGVDDEGLAGDLTALEASAADFEGKAKRARRPDRISEYSAEATNLRGQIEAIREVLGLREQANTDTEATKSNMESVMEQANDAMIQRTNETRVPNDEVDKAWEMAHAEKPMMDQAMNLRNARDRVNETASERSRNDLLVDGLRNRAAEVGNAAGEKFTTDQAAESAAYATRFTELSSEITTMLSLEGNRALEKPINGQTDPRAGELVKQYLESVGLNDRNDGNTIVKVTKNIFGRPKYIDRYISNPRDADPNKRGLMYAARYDARTGDLVRFDAVKRPFKEGTESNNLKPRQIRRWQRQAIDAIGAERRMTPQANVEFDHKNKPRRSTENVYAGVLEGFGVDKSTARTMAKKKAGGGFWQFIFGPR